MKKIITVLLSLVILTAALPVSAHSINDLKIKAVSDLNDTYFDQENQTINIDASYTSEKLTNAIWYGLGLFFLQDTSCSEIQEVFTVQDCNEATKLAAISFKDLQLENSSITTMLFWLSIFSNFNLMK
jgi:hypothetical protein